MAPRYASTGHLTGFPEGGSQWQVSDGGGRDPSWGPDGAELYYRSGDRLIASRVDMEAGGRVLSRRVALEQFRPPLFDDYHIHPDGRTLVMVRPSEDVASQVTVVVSWHDELERRVPAR